MKGMPMVKLVFVDMDGTFLLPDKTISDENLRILDRAYELGVQFVPCTGRNISGLPKQLIGHPCVKYAVCCNGALVCDAKSGEVIHEADLDDALVRELWSNLRNLPVSFDLFADSTVYTTDDCWHFVEEIPVSEPTRLAIKQMRTSSSLSVDELLKECGPVCRVNVFYLDEENKHKVWDIVDANPNLTRASSLPCNIEITRCDANKGTGLKWLCKRLGVDPQETIAFGDASNDVSMLLAAGDGVAMGNALPEALAAADHVTVSNSDSGVARYLEPIFVQGVR